MTKEELKQIRMDMDMKQQEFADYLGIKNSRTIRRMESGDWKISEHIKDKLRHDKKEKKGLDGKGCPMV